MMQMTFDLISDLHIETWSENFDWTGCATSPYAVVAGDIAKDRNVLVQSLQNLGRSYQAVFYVDGNDEHKNYMDNLTSSYKDLFRKINKIPNVVYLQDNVVVVDGIAILGTNGWWAFDFDGITDPEESSLWFQEKESLGSNTIDGIRRMHNTDTNYMIGSVKRLQTHNDVKKIVMVTHTVPDPVLISHDPTLVNTLKFNTMGNKLMSHALNIDTEKKIHTWCFGHYHGDVDQIRNGIRYVNNCRGRGDTPWANWAYHPKRITIDY